MKNKRACITMSACVTIDGRISSFHYEVPNQIKNGGWTSELDKSIFNELVIENDIIMAGRTTANLMPNMGKPFALITSRYSSLNPIPESFKQKGMINVVPPEKESILKFVEANKKSKILLCGGAQTYSLLLGLDLVDYITLTIEPVVLAQGLGLAADSGLKLEKFNKFSLVKSQAFEGGTILLNYKREF